MAKHLVIMAGGIGSRFWPMSTPQKPKQFIDITGCGRTMIQQSFDRFKGIIDIDNVWVVTSRIYKGIVAEQITGINPQHILLEPCMRNTAPCVAYVSWKILKEDPEALIVVAPSDHLVLKVESFQKAINSGLEFISEGNRILTLGIQPTRPETGYGYIEAGDLAHDIDILTEHTSNLGSDNLIFELKAFREKPDLKTAIEYLQKGGYTWNSGIFMWSAKTIVSELRQYAPQIADVMDEILPVMFTEKEQEVVNELFPTCEKISIDYAVMEKTQIAYVQPVEFGWNDLGTWGSLHTLTEHDESDNAVIGNRVKMIECKGNMVKVPNGKYVVIQGLNNCIVSEHDDVLLICQLSEEQRIKEWHD